MSKKSTTIILIVLAFLVITAVIWLILWQSIKPSNQNQNVNQSQNVNQLVGEEKSCQTDNDCILIQKTCCPCSSGGTMTCISKEFKDVLMPLDCSGIACPEVYLCDSQPTTCVCSNNQCEGIRPSVATNVNYSLPDIKNKEECEAHGAHWVAVGKRAVCEFSAPDAGKECNKSTDCVRVCRIDNLDDIIGTCSEFSVGGCHRYLDNEGKARMICSD